ncbi:DUF3995 domain-containing protein [Bacillus pseudomycoides]|uniref:DUF3995 domain-containing protein n=1 Tax=Bacillus pseudomycoides TaxID=64104 RepID=UPI000BF6EA3B|nr:DUF3995 domain-containing protein [Bacillus pseudomycoides]PEP58782.1 hypothetical protein CN564_11815 [Bacillus pseudomycoides]PHC97774.1 hypothetical protein COF36_02430 [Bacillus pseudomycoides]
MDSKTSIDKSNMDTNSALPSPKKREGMSLKRWPSWIGYIAIAWSALYGSMHLYWLLGGEGYPFKNEDGMDLFAGKVTYLPSQVGGIIFVVLCLIGILVGFSMRKPVEKTFQQRLILIYAWGWAAALLLFVPDASLIAAMAYAFLLKFKFDWLMLNQIICVLGGIYWGFFAVAYRRKIRHACEYCGRKADGKTSLLMRWSRWITYLAALAPIPYAITRYAWALKIPLGIDAKFLQDFSNVNPAHHITEWAFGSICIAGSILTLGLIQKWGDTFPRWFPFVNGKRVPILLAVIPASCVAIAVTAAGFTFTFAFIAVKLHLVSTDNILLSHIWGSIGPMLLWILWGIALGLASIAYYYRRRGQCSYCGRNEVESISR